MSIEIFISLGGFILTIGTLFVSYGQIKAKVENSAKEDAETKETLKKISNDREMQIIKNTQLETKLSSIEEHFLTKEIANKIYVKREDFDKVVDKTYQKMDHIDKTNIEINDTLKEISFMNTQLMEALRNRDKDLKRVEDDVRESKNKISKLENSI